jgi:hypothetical protein
MACAYCGASGEMTREHAFSDWIGREFADVGRMESTVQGAPARRFQGLIKTKDVCPACNNGRLSELGNFAKALGMHDDRAPSELKAFRGDREKLTRYLLKCGYNDARANLEKAQNAREPTSKSAARVRECKHFAPCILGTAEAPIKLDVLAGLLDFSASVAVGRMELEDSENRIQFNQWMHLGAHCFLVLGWRDETTPAYKEAILDQLCASPWNWTWLDQDPFDVRLHRVAVAGAILPSGETLPKATGG